MILHVDLKMTQKHDGAVDQGRDSLWQEGELWLLF